MLDTMRNMLCMFPRVGTNQYYHIYDKFGLTFFFKTIDNHSVLFTFDNYNILPLTKLIQCVDSKICINFWNAVVTLLHSKH